MILYILLFVMLYVMLCADLELRPGVHCWQVAALMCVCWGAGCCCSRGARSWAQATERMCTV